MSKHKQQKLFLPKALKEHHRLPTLIPPSTQHNNKVKKQSRYHTELTEEISFRNLSPFHILQPDKQQHQIRQTMNQPKSLCISMGDKIKSENRNKHQRAKIIDTRKSIKILVDYFQSKSQDKQSENGFKFHLSPKKKPSSIVQIKQAAQEYHSIRKSHLKRNTDKELKVQCFNVRKGSQVGRSNRFDSQVQVNSISLKEVRKTQPQISRQQILILNARDHQTPAMINRKRLKKNKAPRLQKMTPLAGWQISLQDTHYPI